MKTLDNTDKKLIDKRFKTDNMKDTSKKYDESFHPKAAEMLARLGLKNYQIYVLFNISEPTGVSWYRRIPEFNLAIKNGRENKVDFRFSDYGGDIELRERFSDLIKENEELKTENESIRNPNRNLEHQRQMKLLNEIAERQNTKPIINKENTTIPVNPISGQRETDAQLNKRIQDVQRQIARDFPDDAIGYMW